ncbi:peptide deformylase [Fictibacillus barbaricus]|uniref:Peptide deformylase n=1 Tax=Fictibacillus barbaricus TaxID=182136 RepID=A0ABU1TY09_9BACL|nr:peptide deformylase [Fictibacillus barbaricus]MDR7072082.1 peptide deformylase [Fictibacillus barbaricus]
MLTMKDIVREGHPVLRQKAAEVSQPFSEEDVAVANQLLEFVKNSQDPEISLKYKLRPGIGLAAPQIGVSKRIFAMHVTDDEGKLYSYALLNPKIISHSVQMTYLDSGEGCLSVDRDVPGFVPRYAKVTVKGYTPDGSLVELKLKGLPGICIQHEMDHLDGIMFYDRIDEKNPFEPPSNSVTIR